MAKAYCPECKKMLLEVLSSFECLSTWNRAQDYYAPGDECKLVKRCPDCGTVTKDKERRIEGELKKRKGTEDVKRVRFKRRAKSRTHSL